MRFFARYTLGTGSLHPRYTFGMSPMQVRCKSDEQKNNDLKKKQTTNKYDTKA